MTDVLETPAPAAAPGTYPVPAGRGRWRTSLHSRAFQDQDISAHYLADLTEARSRKLTKGWDTPATFTFTLDATSPAAAVVQELAHDVCAWRFDDTTGTDVCMFRGLVTASEDDADAQSHSVTFTCLDYLAMLSRRIFTWGTAVPWTAQDTDYLVTLFLNYATDVSATTSSGTRFGAAAYLPLGVAYCNPDGTTRAQGTGISRALTVQGSAVVGTEFDKLAKMNQGFDYDVYPQPMAPPALRRDQLRIFYPQKGVVRTAPALYYPGNVTAFKRQVSSGDYTNYWRRLGNNQNASQNAPQVYGEAWNPDAMGLTVGTFMTGDQVSDQTDTTLLTQGAVGEINYAGVLVPTYELTLAPGAWYQGAFVLGDTLPLIIQSGRLAVNTTIRVLDAAFEIHDDGDEVVTITCGRPRTTLADVLGRQAADIRALARR
jgi:hypothetical protein